MRNARCCVRTYREEVGDLTQGDPGAGVGRGVEVRLYEYCVSALLESVREYLSRYLPIIISALSRLHTHAGRGRWTWRGRHIYARGWGVVR